MAPRLARKTLLESAFAVKKKNVGKIKIQCPAQGGWECFVSQPTSLDMGMGLYECRSSAALVMYSSVLTCFSLDCFNYFVILIPSYLPTHCMSTCISPSQSLFFSPQQPRVQIQLLTVMRLGRVCLVSWSYFYNMLSAFGS